MVASSNKQIGVTNPLKIFSNIFISFIGAGVLGLPYAFKEAGVLEGILVMIVVSVFSSKAMLLLIECKYEILRLRRNKKTNRLSKNGIMTEVKLPLIRQDSDSEEDLEQQIDDEFLSYGDIGYHALGTTGRSLVDASIIVSQIGFCCAYLIFITENLASYIPGLSKYHWLIVILPPLFCITLLRQLDRLAFFSLFAQMSNIFAFAVVFWFDFQHFHKLKFHPKEFSLKGFPLYFAIAIYCYEGAGMVLSLEHSISPHIRYRFKSYFIVTMVAVTALYISFGASGYLSFGPRTKQIITMNLPHKRGFDFAALVKLCLCVALFCTYPIMMFPVVQLLEKRCGGVLTTTQQNFYRLLLVSVTGVIVMVVPDFAHLMALVGATCCTLLAFILPALFHILIFKMHQFNPQLALNSWLLVLGTLGAVVGIMDAVNRMGENEVVSVVRFQNTSITSVPYDHINVTKHPLLDNVNITKYPISANNDTKHSVTANDFSIAKHTIAANNDANITKHNIAANNDANITKYSIAANNDANNDASTTKHSIVANNNMGFTKRPITADKSALLHSQSTDPNSGSNIKQQNSIINTDTFQKQATDEQNAYLHGDIPPSLSKEPFSLPRLNDSAPKLLSIGADAA